MFTDLLKKLIIKVSNWFSCGLSVSKNHNISELWSRKTNFFDNISVGTYGFGLPTLRKRKRPQVVLKFLEVAAHLSLKNTMFFIPDL